MPEAAAVPASSPALEMKRFLMVKRRFESVTMGQDRLIQEYQKRARLVIHLHNGYRDLTSDVQQTR